MSRDACTDYLETNAGNIATKPAATTGTPVGSTTSS
jgi:hypothetical protein